MKVLFLESILEVKLIFTLIFVLIFSLAMSIRINMGHIQEAIDTEHYVIIPLADATSTLAFDIVEIQQWLTDISATRALDGLDDGFEVADVYAKDAVIQLNRLNELLPNHTALISEIEQKLSSYYSVGIDSIQQDKIAFLKTRSI